jgi:hypothetical protein
MPKPYKPDRDQRKLILTAETIKNARKDAKIRQHKAKIDLGSKEEYSLVDRALQQIKDRELATPFGFWTYKSARKISDRRQNPHLWLLHSNYMASYTHWEQWWLSSSYLCGHTDNHDWAVRVPGTLITVDEALSWITPAQVKKAQKAKQPVYRQGDMYFIWSDEQDTIMDKFAPLVGTRHMLDFVYDDNWSVVAFKINHPQHPPVTLDVTKRWRALQQRQLDVGGRRAGAD